MPPTDATSDKTTTFEEGAFALVALVICLALWIWPCVSLRRIADAMERAHPAVELEVDNE